MATTARYRSMSRFVLRTPTLPFDVLASWSQLPDAAARRDALRRLVDDPAVREALFLASPELDGQIAAWQRAPETPSGVAIERALVRYISRMASRSTPFGLFASVSVGALGEATRLELPPRAGARRSTRLDNDLLFALCADLAREPGARSRLRFRPNSSLYLAAARLRYAEARRAGSVRAYHLVAVERTGYLDALLARASRGATRSELVDVLCADPEITPDEAAAFIDEVVDAQILVPELAPAVTGREPIEGIIATLESQKLEQFAGPLRVTRTALREIDAAPPGVASEAYRAIEKLLAATLPTKVEANRLFQVDMFKPALAAALDPLVVDEVRRGVELLHALSPAGSDPVWTQFRERFTARYETREVPLLEVLDEESGIGFGDHGPSPRAAPLLADLAFPTRATPRQAALRPRDVYLMSLVAGALRDGATEIELGDEDVAKLSERDPSPLADLIAVQCQLVAGSARAVADGSFKIRINGVGRGANLLGRFCHGSPEVRSLTDECLAAEEALHPEAVFAEIVHLPEGRIGNVLLRPVLRGYEIPYLGTSGAAPDRQLDVNDLMVSVAGDRVVLRSRRLGREVIPRMTTAHNFSSRSMTVYRFLCSHAQQNTGHAFWSWGVMNDMPFLPRVQRGKIVLERARWILLAKDLAPLEAAFAGSGAAKTPEQIRAIRTRVAVAIAELRQRLRLPRWIVIGDGDNELPVDLENELMVDSAAHLLKGRPTATVFELLPGPDQLCARGSEGTFAHELVVMLAKDSGEPAATMPRSAPPAAPAARSLAVLADPATPRRFLPGSSWLYLKLYTGRATADLLLREYLAPAINSALDQGLATRWFFLRYGDPDWHLRLRFEGDPLRMTAELLPLLHAALAPATERGLVWRIAVDTYEREVERYGGLEGLVVAEHLFHHDSDCALSIIASCDGDAGVEAAWRLALRGIDRLMDDLGFSLDDKLATMTIARDGFGAEIGMDTAFQKRLGEKYRAHRNEIAVLLDAPDDDPDHPFGPAFQMLAERSRKLRPIGDHLRELEAAGRLGLSVVELAHSYIHMHVNRMIRTSQRLHELVMYDLLRRHYDGIAARLRRRRSA